MNQNDLKFVSELQKEQQLLTISPSLCYTTKESEAILKIRELFNVVRDNKGLKDSLMNDIDTMYLSYMMKGRENTKEDSAETIEFSNTGICKLKYDRRK